MCHVVDCIQSSPGRLSPSQSKLCPRLKIWRGMACGRSSNLYMIFKHVQNQPRLPKSTKWKTNGLCRCCLVRNCQNLTSLSPEMSSIAYNCPWVGPIGGGSRVWVEVMGQWAYSCIHGTSMDTCRQCWTTLEIWQLCFGLSSRKLFCTACSHLRAHSLSIFQSRKVSVSRRLMDDLLEPLRLLVIPFTKWTQWLLSGQACDGYERLKY